jgi:uncharacterized protein (TIGR00369 family)
MKLRGQALIDVLNERIRENTLMQTLDIKFIKAEGDTLTASMPVTPKVHQPLGWLHGGATAALAESVGSPASYMFINPDEYEVRGIDLSVNHVGGKREGMVYATAKPLHIGRTLHLWEIAVTDEQGKLISHAKLTNIILKKK